MIWKQCPISHQEANLPNLISTPCSDRKKKHALTEPKIQIQSLKQDHHHHDCEKTIIFTFSNLPVKGDQAEEILWISLQAAWLAWLLQHTVLQQNVNYPFSHVASPRGKHIPTSTRQGGETWSLAAKPQRSAASFKWFFCEFVFAAWGSVVEDDEEAAFTRPYMAEALYLISEEELQ